MSLTRESFISEKAQQIAFALIKISVYIRRPFFRQKMEQLGFELLEAVNAEDFQGALMAAKVLTGFVRIGKTIYEIEPINAKILLQEIESLNQAITKDYGLFTDEEENALEGVFSAPPIVNENLVKGISSQNASSLAEDHDEAGNNGNGNGIGATIRQSAIIEKIRQNGKQIQLKDIIAEFPDVSERTIRYDLQKLCNQGVIERVGNGGPGSFYALKM